MTVDCDSEEKLFFVYYFSWCLIFTNCKKWLWDGILILGIYNYTSLKNVKKSELWKLLSWKQLFAAPGK